MSVQFVVDSGADFTPAQRKQLGLHLVPLKVIFPDGEYLDGVDITPRTYYEKMAATKTLPTTSMASVYDYTSVIEPLIAQSDDVIIFTISSKLSGTIQSAHIAAQSYPGRVFIVDSLNITAAIQIQVEYGLRLKAQGLSAAEIAQELVRARDNVRLVAILDTLENLKKGGRISRAVAFAGEILGIKLVVRVHEGVVDILGKARGLKRGYAQMADCIRANGDIDFDMPARLAYTGADEAVVQNFLAGYDGQWQGRLSALSVCHAGSCIGTHAGPGVVAMCFYAKNHE